MTLRRSIAQDGQQLGTPFWFRCRLLLPPRGANAILVVEIEAPRLKRGASPGKEHEHVQKEDLTQRPPQGTIS